MANPIGRPMPGQTLAMSGPNRKSGSNAFPSHWRAGLALAVVLCTAVMGFSEGQRGSPLVAAATLAALVVIARARCRDWRYPPVVQAALWAFLCLWFWLTQDNFYSVGTTTWYVILMGAASFSLGGWLTTRGHKPALARNDVARGSLPSGFGRAILLALSVGILPFFLMAAFSTLSSPGAYLSLIADVRAASSREILFGRLYIGFWWALTSLGVTFLTYLRRPWKKASWFFLALAALVALAYAVPMGGRNSILFVLVILCAIPLVLRRVRPSRIAAGFAVSVALIFVSYAYLAGQMGLNVRSPSLADSKTVTDTASLYMVGPIVALSSVRPASAESSGLQTFRIVYLWLSYIGLNVHVKPIVQAFVPVSPTGWTNIYTVYHSYYLEFGTVGVVLCQFIFGIGHGILYRRATMARPKAMWIMLYVISLYPLLMQGTTDMYLPNVSNWINFCIICVIAFRLFRAKSPYRVTRVTGISTRSPRGLAGFSGDAIPEGSGSLDRAT